MVKYVEFGEYNKNYNFIFLAVVFWILMNYFPKFSILILFKYNIISKNVLELYNHSNIISIFTLFGSFVFSCILNKYENKLSRGESNLDELNAPNSDKGCFKSIKISEKKKKENLNNRKNFLYILVIIIICLLSEIILSIILFLKIFSYSMIALLITSFINTKMFKIKIYKHQKCAIFFNFIVLFIFQLISFVLSMLSENDKYLYKQHFWLIPIGLIIYFLIIIVSSYTYSKIKWFMDLNWISLSKLLINFMLVGFLINTIICVLFTFINCSENKNIFCVKEEDGTYYIENFMIFFEKLLEICRDENKFDLIFMICLICLLSLIVFLYNFFVLSTLKNLYPEYYFFTTSIRETLIEIMVLFQNKISQGYFFAKKEDDYKISFIQFILDIIGNLLIIVGFLIYLEIIELNFCGFNYNLRKNIIDRGIKDIQEINEDEEQNEYLIDNNSNKSLELLINPLFSIVGLKDVIFTSL